DETAALDREAPSERCHDLPRPGVWRDASLEGGAKNSIARLAHERHRQAVAGRNALDLAGPERQAADLAGELHHHRAHQRAAHPRPEALVERRDTGAQP